jgi:hypothetical protein
LQVPALDRGLPVFEHRHRRQQGQEAELSIQAFLARHRLEEDPFVAAGVLHQALHDLPADAAPLPFGQLAIARSSGTSNS